MADDAATPAGPAPAADDDPWRPSPTESTDPVHSPGTVGAEAPADAGAPVRAGAPTDAGAPGGPAAPATPEAPTMADPAAEVAQSPQSPESEQTPEPAAGQAAAPGLEAEDIRRAWPAIRDAVRKRTRTVEVMLAGATVAGVDGRVIHLVHDYAPLAKRLSQPHNATAITDSVAEVVGGDWTIRCTSGATATAAAAPTPVQGRGAAPAPAEGPPGGPQTEPQGWQRRLRDGDAGKGQAQGDRRSAGGSAPAGGYDDIPPPPEEPEPEPGEPGGPPSAPVSEEEMVDEARSGPQNLDHRTGEDIALQLLKEHLGARPLER